ncbi:MAG: YjbH domain-containing protein, partial [Armatimonadota bacterium]|nr:YjbH domain-containing protein [Armatimonadota bacterium]
HQFGVAGSMTDLELDLDPTDKYESAFAYYQHDWGELGLKSRLGYGQFLESGERGFALSLRRRFGESVLETRAVRTEGGGEGLMFELSVPLGPRRSSSPETVRPRLDTAFRADYVSDFNVQGDYLQGRHDLESFRGEISPAYVQEHGERLIDGEEAEAQGWPAAPSWEGTSGLIRIPTADVAPDARLLTGISYMDADHSKVAGTRTDAMPTYIGVGFLPNLELIGRLTFFHDVKAYNWNYNLDRSFNVHYRLNRQRGEWFPALAVGGQDVTFGTTTSYVGKAEYLVGSWRRDHIRLHLGLGSGRLDPLFGGFDFALGDDHKVHLMADYDSDYFNTGLRWFMGDWGTASVGLLGLEDLTGSVTLQTKLR